MGRASRDPRAAARHGATRQREGDGLAASGRYAGAPSRIARLEPALALLPLRLFLGVTFAYAGAQKLSDPGFLRAGAPTYIGEQLQAFSTGTPGGFLLRAFALPFPALAGVGVALAEIAIGLLTTAGFLTRAAAAAGLGLNAVLFLTASWKTSPYFLGSDIVFAFAWLPFVLAGAAGQPALDTVLQRRARPERAPAATRPSGDAAGEAVLLRHERGRETLSRRAVLRRGLAVSGLLTLGLAGLATLLKGTYEGERVLADPAGSPPARANASAGSPHHSRKQPGRSAEGTRRTESKPTARPARKTQATPAVRRSAVPQDAVLLGRSSAVQSGQAVVYRDPNDGSADILVRRPGGGLTALSAVCTHAGCEVSYQSGVLYCPCHGSVFNAETGAVEQGPAVDPLAVRHVIERDGQIYAIPS